MEVRYALVGYDKKTEKLAFRAFVPSHSVATAKKIAHIPDSAAAELGDWELEIAQARDIAGLIPVEVDATRQDYFLEPYADA